FQDGPKGLLIAAILFALCMFILRNLVEITAEIKTFTYTEFQKSVEQDLVKSVSVQGQDVQGVLKDGTQFETIIPYNPFDWELLKTHGVNVTIANTGSQFSLLYIIIFASVCLVLLLIV